MKTRRTALASIIYLKRIATSLVVLACFAGWANLAATKLAHAGEAPAALAPLSDTEVRKLLDEMETTFVERVQTCRQLYRVNRERFATYRDCKIVSPLVLELEGKGV